MLKKRWSVCQIRWDTIVILFHNLQKRSSLKRGLNLNAKKYFIVETIYCLQWLRHSICILITKLHLQLVELSKTANINCQYISTVSSHIWIAKRNIHSEYYWNNRPSPNKKRKKDTWSRVTIHKKWVPVSEVERLVFSVWRNTQFFTFYFNCMTK